MINAFPVDLTENYLSKENIKVWECSNCKHTFEEINGLYPYCPFCRKKIIDRKKIKND